MTRYALRFEKGRKKEGRTRLLRRRYRWDPQQAKLVEIAPDAPSPGRGGFTYIADECEPFRSHADGKMYTSKSSYRRELRARGFVEVGDQKGYLQSGTTVPNVPKREYVNEIKRAARQLGMDVL